MSSALAITVVFRFLGAGLYVFLTGVLWGQRRTAPAGWATVALMAALGVWDLAFPLPLAWVAAAAVTAAFGNLARIAWQQRHRDIAAGLGSVWALWALGIAAGMHSPAAAVAALFPGLYLAWLFYWTQPFGLVLTNRSLFAVAMGIFAALYLLAVRLGAEMVEQRVGRFRWALELALLFWAGLLWIPFYAWISRFLSGRARVYSEFGKTVIEEAARILDLEKRLEFFARQLAGRLKARKVIFTSGEQQACWPAGQGLSEAQRKALEAFALSVEGDSFAVARIADVPARGALEAAGCNYLFPLRYEDRLAGLLLADTSPRQHLEDDEAVMQALVPQISQSIEACRLVEEKIGLERQLARQENLAALGEAAATIAHEIKNPLSSIKTLARLMREDEAVAASHGKDLEFIETEVDRMDRSVRQLLGFSRSNQKLDETVDVSALLEGVCRIVGRQSKASGVEVRSRIAPGLARENSNRELVEQVLLNLVLNAAQASPAGSAVEVSGEPGIAIVVRDHGPGIPPEQRARVFEPFFTTRQRGTGLGLAIVRRNLRLLGGEIGFEFPGEGGTVARVRL